MSQALVAHRGDTTTMHLYGSFLVQEPLEALFQWTQRFHTATQDTAQHTLTRLVYLMEQNIPIITLINIAILSTISPVNQITL